MLDCLVWFDLGSIPFWSQDRSSIVPHPYISVYSRYMTAAEEKRRKVGLREIWGDFLSPAGASHFFRLAAPRIGDGYRKLSLTPTGVPNES